MSRRFDIGHGLSCQVFEITPSVAKSWMENNSGNFRKMDPSRVSAYAMDVAAGLWDLNGETIVFGADGQLKNGQHRLAAVIKADKSILSLVVWGTTCDAKHIDRGKPRTVGQWISHSGIKNANLVAAISRLCVGHEKGLWSKKGWSIGEMTDNEIIGFADNYHEAINASASGCRVPGVPLSHLVAVMFTGCRLRDINDSQTAVWFRDGLVNGTELCDTDAVLHLKNKLGKQPGMSKLPFFMTRMLTTVAWNKTVEGVACSTLRITLTGPSKQKLPERVLQVDDI